MPRFGAAVEDAVDDALNWYLTAEQHSFTAAA